MIRKGLASRPHASSVRRSTILAFASKDIELRCTKPNLCSQAFGDITPNILVYQFS
jgi:hypothetical protein